MSPPFWRRSSSESRDSRLLAFAPAQPWRFHLPIALGQLPLGGGCGPRSPPRSCCCSDGIGSIQSLGLRCRSSGSQSDNSAFSSLWKGLGAPRWRRSFQAAISAARGFARAADAATRHSIRVLASRQRFRLSLRAKSCGLERVQKRIERALGLPGQMQAAAARHGPASCDSGAIAGSDSSRAIRGPQEVLIEA